MSGTLGIGKRVRCELMKPSLENALWMAASQESSSPPAVAMTQMRGCAPACASSAASRYEGPGRMLAGSGPSSWKPMEVAMMVGWRAATSGGEDLGVDDVQRPRPRHEPAQVLGDHGVWLDSVS